MAAATVFIVIFAQLGQDFGDHFHQFFQGAVLGQGVDLDVVALGDNQGVGASLAPAPPPPLPAR
ncbi:MULTISPECIES: hypothetical protein [Neomoorella]|uniref:hypothetical protein n=1 Tax=Neomoorella TaxID=44260 RepID=UPI0015A6C78A|nr:MULTISPECIES: hypothetical protein [Moorella]BCV22539.1 hypothetical protein hamaS1_26080 [Moorella sp. Hama-1]